MDKTTKSSQKIQLSISWKQLCFVLLAVIVAIIFLWKPWQSSGVVRKISVSGDATIKATPDEYVISPYFEFTNVDNAKAQQDLATQSEIITTKLKDLGVTNDQIKSNTNNYERYTGYPAAPEGQDNTLMQQFTITLSSKDIAQKVQDYLLTLKPKGQISPQAGFSTTMRKDLETQSREKAIDDANAKATKTASQLGLKVGKVITISDGSSYGGIMTGSAMSAVEAKSADISIPVYVGQDEYNTNIMVEYELK